MIMRIVSSLIVAGCIWIMAPIADFVFFHQSASDTLGAYLQTSELLQYLPYALIAGMIWFMLVRVVKKALVGVVFVLLLIAVALYFGLANNILT